MGLGARRVYLQRPLVAPLRVRQFAAVVHVVAELDEVAAQAPQPRRVRVLAERFVG